MYDIFEKLLDERGVTRYQVSKATGVPQSSLSDWSKGKSKPKYENMKKIADYFNVSVDYLLGNEETPATQETDELYELLEDVRRNPELRAMFSITKKATPEQVRQYIKVIKALRGEDDDE